MVPSAESVLEVLQLARLLDLCRRFGVSVRGERATKAKVLPELAAQLGGRLHHLVLELSRDELRAACLAHHLPAEAAARRALQSGLLEAAGIDPGKSLPPPVKLGEDALPEPGQVVQARHRQWLVEALHRGQNGESARVDLVCLDDDATGEPLEVLWDLELGARVIDPASRGLGDVRKLDTPEAFGAYLHALKWSAVSAADATRFQAPFRAGIKLMAHQLTPLMKALELPRANLFIADDVGLGKTIEAGLVLQELILRQQAEFVLIVAPAAICLQWRDEMQRRFGLRFEVMTQRFVAYRRQDRGAGINPWSTYHRFIISYELLRRDEYRSPLLAHLGERVRKGLFILDEAHRAAPASHQKYAVDSDTTRTIRELAAKFDNRLFLSATPHNGHSNSFSALLEILDPARFTRGVPIEDTALLKPVMVRRLKRDLRQLGLEEHFPRRVLVQHALHHDEGAWHVKRSRFDAEARQVTEDGGEPLGPGGDDDLRLAHLLTEYTSAVTTKTKRDKLALVQLQQRMLSSPEAFARSLEVHARKHQDDDLDLDPELYGDAEEAPAVALDTLGASSAAQLSDLRALVHRARKHPDAKVRALLHWMRTHMCPAIGKPGAGRTEWSARRVIIFTEWTDTKRYLQEILTQALEHTDRADERIMVFHGGMGDDSRDAVQRAFNDAAHPVRVLLATDAAREGINLQAQCADLFHFDLPWNPARLEQRNGRIDRTLQPAEEVRCHYFIYPQRPADRVLETLVRKVETVQKELGSLGAVLLDDAETWLADGLTERVRAKLEALGEGADVTVVNDELESSRTNMADLVQERDRAAQRLETSRKALEVSPQALRTVLDVGLGLAAGQRLAAVEGRAGVYTLPELDRSWAETLDTLRPARARDESFMDWRRKPPRPVTFTPVQHLGSDTEHLHLAHPLVRRVLDRFLAQGFSAHDLSRASAVVVPDDSVIRVVAYGRLTLFGARAARLHDEIIAVAARWDGQSSEVSPYKDRETQRLAARTAETALSTAPRAAPGTVVRQVAAQAEALFKALWPALEAEADAQAAEARNGLMQRARKESDDLQVLLGRQRAAISQRLPAMHQLELLHTAKTEADRRTQTQLKHDLAYMQEKLANLEAQIATEPAAIAALYDVQMTRVMPVGLVVTWPEVMV